MKDKPKPLGDKLGGLPKLSGKTEMSSDNGYRYDTRKSVSVSLKFPGEMDDKLRREAYIRNLSYTDMVKLIVAKHQDGKDFPPVPEKNLDL